MAGGSMQGTSRLLQLAPESTKHQPDVAGADTPVVQNRRLEGSTQLPGVPMDGDIARVVIVGIIGGTITISMLMMAVARIFSSRRRHRELPESSVARLEERLERMEQAIDAMATEVERVAEGQRFTSRLLAGKQVERQP